MPGSRKAVRYGTAPRELIEQLARERPELLPWLLPLRIALGAIGIEPWRSFAPLPAAVRDAAAPALHGATIPVDAAAARAHVGAVLGAAFAPAQRAHLDAIDPVALLECAVAQDDDRLAGLAEQGGLDSAHLGATAQLAALPLLHASARVLAPAPRDDWCEHYCPVCGAPPLLVEVLGLDRARQLRCGRCGSGWNTHVLLCPFCGEHDHARLGSLVPEGPAGQVCWVETCATCHAYWKARAVLRPAPPEVLLIDDVRSLELDVIAADRGFARPTRHGFQVRVRVAPLATVGSRHG